MGEAPHPPWELCGEAIVAVAGAPSEWPVSLSLPVGVRALPGPLVLVGAAYADAPPGPYVELVVARPAAVGLRPGLCVVRLVVGQVASQAMVRAGYRSNWGFPAEVGVLRWSVDGDSRRLMWEEGGLVVTGRAAGVAVPAWLPGRSVQRRSDGPVLVPRRMAGRLHVGRVFCEVATADPDFGFLAGRHLGGVLAGLRLVLHPARLPTGLLSSLRAPVRAPEPAVFAGSAGPVE